MSVARSGTLLSLLCTGLDRIHLRRPCFVYLTRSHRFQPLHARLHFGRDINLIRAHLMPLDPPMSSQNPITLRCFVFVFFFLFLEGGGATRVVFPRRYGNARVSGGIIGE